jgi:hypothetical protein
MHKCRRSESCPDVSAWFLFAQMSGSDLGKGSCGHCDDDEKRRCIYIHDARTRASHDKRERSRGELNAKVRLEHDADLLRAGGSVGQPPPSSGRTHLRIQDSAYGA